MSASSGSGEGWTAGQRLQAKVAVVIGGGQSPGEGTGNGRAVAMRFAREGARVLVCDRNLEAAQATAALIREEGFEAVASKADVTVEQDLAAVMDLALARWGRLDILHNNVGISLAGGDADLLDITEESFDFVSRVNLRGTVFACKHAVPIMRRQRAGAIVNVASAAGPGLYPYVAYKASKAGVIAFTEQLALQNAGYGIRANAILPGLIGTPMAVEARVSKFGKSREDVEAERAAKVPMKRQGTAWDVANAALYLASDEAGFVTGVSLLVDGGRILNRV
ncbi:SDR family oxidoreductase [Pigmentiphaga sp. H8]|uniref:SDR family NAD(P)-dependent oxidoreductase n=1 Tax=Pigmentiphaga sp. H8 TaxID=2488560 RepID=UPI000F5B42E6|nr:SDR family NAD(P)-dependent oxidoreductase [Pigmentiphaga sp. H8]AZG08264.1 SDR family oxidoreductase [Pigmentiphaga sp. H8]